MSESTRNCRPALSPNQTLVALLKPVPVTVTSVFPDAGPRVGANPVTVGAAALLGIETGAGVGAGVGSAHAVAEPPTQLQDITAAATPEIHARITDDPIALLLRGGGRPGNKPSEAPASRRRLCRMPDVKLVRLKLVR
ncbi:hypothetical protein [Micropruina sp.]|uniref:hypothetical protein n=1 Tax=Micropruina sp. TaxID=2737536 RepID=UPI0039E2AC0C